MEEKTWGELKAMRDSGSLSPGTKYRITDYTTTTTATNTKSAGNAFDIIVEALTENTLSENARACLHSSSTSGSGSSSSSDYFGKCKLEAWELKYCLDNDTDRFDWANDSSSGRGVIYYMKDEWGNEAPYDFKNIKFKHASHSEYMFTFSKTDASGSYFPSAIYDASILLSSDTGFMAYATNNTMRM